MLIKFRRGVQDKVLWTIFHEAYNDLMTTNGIELLQCFPSFSRAYQATKSQFCYNSKK